MPITVISIKHKLCIKCIVTENIKKRDTSFIYFYYYTKVSNYNTFLFCDTYYRVSCLKYENENIGHVLFFYDVYTAAVQTQQYVRRKTLWLKLYTTCKVIPTISIRFRTISTVTTCSVYFTLRVLLAPHVASSAHPVRAKIIFYNVLEIDKQ